MRNPKESINQQSASSDQLLAFMQYLRGKKIPVSPADTLDAIEAAELLGYSDRALLKNGLAATLAKSNHELKTFESAFDEYFQLAANTSAATALATNEEPQATPNPDVPPSQENMPPENAPDPLEGLRGNALFDSLESQDESALSVAIETAAAEVRVEDISLFTQRGQYVRTCAYFLSQP